MSLGFPTGLRNSRLDQITALAGNGALLRIYDGSRPATGGAATTKLGELVCGSPFAPGAAAGVLTPTNPTQDSAADATGTATWFRVVKADGTTHVMDGSAGVSGTDMILNTASIVVGGPITVTAWTVTEANA